MTKQKLVLTFVPKDEQTVETTVSTLKSSYTITDNKIYQFDVTHVNNDNNEFIPLQDYTLLSYNVSISNTDILYPNTLICHRRKENGIITLFTMNGLNSLKEEFGGEIDWKKYHNKLILVRDNKLSIASLKLRKLINF